MYGYCHHNSFCGETLWDSRQEQVQLKEAKLLLQNLKDTCDVVLMKALISETKRTVQTCKEIKRIPKDCKWKLRPWPQLPVMGVGVGLMWWRPGQNPSYRIGRVGSITSIFNKLRVTWHFDPLRNTVAQMHANTHDETPGHNLRVLENQLCNPYRHTV